MEIKIVLKFNGQMHKTLAEKYGDDIASSNQRTVTTWNEGLISLSIYKIEKKEYWLFIHREKLRKVYTPKVLAIRANFIY